MHCLKKCLDNHMLLSRLGTVMSNQTFTFGWYNFSFYREGKEPMRLS